MSSKIVHAAIALGACASLFTATEAFAADPPPSCDHIKALDTNKDGNFSTTDAPPPVYVTGSSALKPIIAALAPAIFSASTRPATIVYLSQGSCVGVSSIVVGTPGIPVTNTAAASPKYASYWDPNSLTTAGSAIPGTSSATLKEQACAVTAPDADPTATSHAVDIGASDVFAESCNYSIANLPQFADFQGPIQSMTFTVNASSSEHSISAEAAYLTFGKHVIAPWTNTSHIFRRNASSGTQVMIGTAIGLDPNSWTGSSGGGDKGSSDGVYAALTSGLSSQTDFNDAIGILSADYSAKSGVRALGYQHYGQHCPYTPDIAAGDKRNTREGRYAIWGPIHLLTQVDQSTGLAKNPLARDFINYLLGTTAPPLGIDLIRLTNQLDVVPPCAMKVQRKSEMGPITPFAPTRSCNCAYDIAAGVTTSTATQCKSCASSSDCSGNQNCSFGYCE